MLIFWGTRTTKKKVGYAADYCPCCNDIVEAKIIRYAQHRHLYFIPLSRSRTLRFDAKCPKCPIVWETDPQSYLNLVRRPIGNIGDSIRETNPQVSERKKTREHLAKMAKNGELNAVTKDALLKEPFKLASRIIEERYSEASRLDWTASKFLLAVFSLITAFLLVASLAGPGLSSAMSYSALITLLVGGFWTLCLIATENERYVRRRIEPAIANGIANYSPEPSELDGILQQYRQCRMLIGRKVKTTRLMNLIQNRSVDQSPTSQFGQRQSPLTGN